MFETATIILVLICVVTLLVARHVARLKLDAAHGEYMAAVEAGMALQRKIYAETSSRFPMSRQRSAFEPLPLCEQAAEQLRRDWQQDRLYQAANKIQGHLGAATPAHVSHQGPKPKPQ